MAAKAENAMGDVLFTPGPLQTSKATKEAMLKDYAGRDTVFCDAVKSIRADLVAVAGADPNEWTCLLLQGPGTFGIEAAASSTTPRIGGRYLVLRGGKYAERQGDMCRHIGIDTVFFDTPEGQLVDLVALEKYLAAEGHTVTNVGMVHHETSTGMINPVADVLALVRRYSPKAVFILDSMSFFGGHPFAVNDLCDVLITSANKCIHGVPGFSILLFRKSLVERFAGNSRSFTLDICAQVKALDKTGQFLFTPPVHTIMAFRNALDEFLRAGGAAARAERYRALYQVLVPPMLAMGFTLFLKPGDPSTGNIVVAFNMATHPKWSFPVFNKHVRSKGLVLYPGKASNAETFRVGLIGDLFAADMQRFVQGAREALDAMGIKNLKEATRSKL